MGSNSTEKPTGLAESPRASQMQVEPGLGAPDFTPEQWKWLKARASRFERAYVPTGSLFPGI